jgi:hypothetical protein
MPGRTPARAACLASTTAPGTARKGICYNDAVVSEIVLFELHKTRDPRKRAMLVEAVAQHAIGLLDIAA